MKLMVGFAVIGSAFVTSAAYAEIQDCIEIASLPAVITQPGIHCMKQDLATSMTSGSAITVNANNVTIEMNDFKLGGLGAGVNTNATGIYAYNRQNLTIRNGTIRGFANNVKLEGAQVNGTSNGHLIENIRSESARYISLWVMGSNSVVRSNLVLTTGNGGFVTAYGIVVQFGQGHTVMNNVVNDVTETSEAYGIKAADTVGAIVQDNQVRNVTATYSYGIHSTGERTVIQRNTVTNYALGYVGIDAQRTFDACLNNVVTRYTSPLTTCTSSSGNTSF